MPFPKHFFSILEASGVHPGAIWANKWPKDSQKPPQTDPKIDQKSMKIGHGAPRVAKRLPRHPPGRPQGSKISQNLTKITPNDPKIVEKSTHQAIQLLIYSVGGVHGKRGMQQTAYEGVAA